MRSYRREEGEEGAKCRERGDASATKAKMLQGRQGAVGGGGERGTF